MAIFMAIGRGSSEILCQKTSRVKHKSFRNYRSGSPNHTFSYHAQGSAIESSLVFVTCMTLVQCHYVESCLSVCHMLYRIVRILSTPDNVISSVLLTKMYYNFSWCHTHTLHSVGISLQADISCRLYNSYTDVMWDHHFVAG